MLQWPLPTFMFFFSHCLALLKGHVEMQSEKCVLSAVSKHLTASCH